MYYEFFPTLLYSLLHMSNSKRYYLFSCISNFIRNLLCSPSFRANSRYLEYKKTLALCVRWLRARVRVSHLLLPHTLLISYARDLALPQLPTNNMRTVCPYSHLNHFILSSEIKECLHGFCLYWPCCYNNRGIWDAFRVIVRKEGPLAIYKGVVATVIVWTFSLLFVCFCLSISRKWATV